MTTHPYRTLSACLFSLSLLLCTPHISCAEEWTPEKIVHAFFDRTGIKNKEAIYGGEMIDRYLDKPTLGQMLAPDTKVEEIRLLEQTKHRAIYAVSISNKGNVLDYYLFLEKDKGAWKLDAVRTLWLPGLFSIVLEELEKKKDRTAQEESQYRNMLLTMRSDRDLKQFLAANIKTLQEIADLVKSGNREKADRLAQGLNLNKVFLPEDYPGIIEINIGGMIDNAVGFLYVPDGRKPPGMSSGGYIYVEKVFEHWYLYKTT